MEEVIVYILVGSLGGFVRALYGLMKSVSKGSKVNKGYFVSSVITSATIGGILASVFNTDYRVAALAGYAGTDFLENIYKGIIRGDVVLTK